MTQAQLEREILEAHRHGDKERLHQLQALYRGRDVVRPAGGEIRWQAYAAPAAVPLGGWTVTLPADLHADLDAMFEHPEETAGWLVGRWDDRRIAVTEMSSLTHGERHEVTISTRQALEIFDRLVDAESGLELVGTVHSHPFRPYAVRSVAPSESDYRTWRKFSGVLDAPHLGLIVSGPSREGDWRLGDNEDAEIKGWITTPGGKTEPATLRWYEGSATRSWSAGWRL